MTHPLYAASVPAFERILNALSCELAKAQTHATQHKFEPAVLLQSRLYPDMWPLLRQVQVACDFAKGTASRLAGLPVPSWEDKEQSIEDLQARIRRTLDYLGTMTEAQFEGSESRPIAFTAGGNELKFPDGGAYLHKFGLPNFYFHATTAYAILRANGVPVGKLDFLGKIF